MILKKKNWLSNAVTQKKKSFLSNNFFNFYLILKYFQILLISKWFHSIYYIYIFVISFLNDNVRLCNNLKKK